MGLGKVIGLGIVFVFLLIMSAIGVIDAVVAVTQGSVLGIPLTGAALAGYLAGSLVWVVIAGVVGWLFIRAYKEYRASRAGKPLQ
jgi:uncharacterized membrane protein YcaP (DUF421 family)